jgi:predicted outer membrane repeat protein
MRNRDPRWVVPLATLLFTANSSSAATIRVPADAPTIQAGIDAAADGDSVLVAPGTYTGSGNKNLDFNGKDIVLTSESGAANTIIDCQYNGRGFIFHSGETSNAIVEGVTVQHGVVQQPGRGEALQIQTAAPTIRGCVFIDNGYPYSIGAGAVACLSKAHPIFAQCTFLRNHSSLGPGGAIYSVGSQATITDCVFDSNRGEGGGGALYVQDGTLVVTGSTFRDNRMDFQQGEGGAVLASGSTLILESCTLLRNTFGAVVIGGGHAEIRGCTFVHNDGWTFGYIVGSGLTVYGAFATIENSIFAFGGEGPAIMNRAQGGGCAATCTDIFGNAGGDWVDCVEGQNGINGNISADPLFCDHAQDDFRLDERSPCAPDNSGGCGLIGAHGVGCRTTAADPTTWGHLKWIWQDGRAVRR